VIPKTGMVFSKRDEFSEIMCKPKLIPLKSLNLMKLEEMEKELLIQNNATNAEIQNTHIK
jgi:BBSome-interacting protein 1